MTQPAPDSSSSSYMPALTINNSEAFHSISAKESLSLGNQYYLRYHSRKSSYDLEQAISHYKAALEKDGQLAEAHVKLASSLWLKGEIPLETALSYCDNGLGLNPEDGEAHLFKGYLLYHAGHLDEAHQHFELSIRKAKASFTGKARMALGQLLLRKLQMAWQKKSPLPNQFPLLIQLLGLLVGGLFQLIVGCCLLPFDQQTFHQLKDAFRTDVQVFSLLLTGRFLRLIHLKQSAIALYKKSTRLLPHEPLFFHLLGDLLANKNQPEDALVYYQQAKVLDSANPLLEKKLGHLHHACGNMSKAIQHFEQSIEMDSADLDTLFYLSQLYCEESNYLQAMAYFKILLSKTPDNPYLHSQMGYALLRLEDYDGAINAYQQAVQNGQDPVWTASIAHTLGMLYYQIRHDLINAAQMLGMAYRLDPNDEEPLLMLGDIYTEMGHFERAMKTYRHLLSLNPENANCYTYLGYLLWQMDRNDEAVVAYNKSLTLNQENPVAYNNLGVIYLDEKCQLEQALQLFEQAALLKPDYTLACFNAARTLEGLGRTAEAAKRYSDALKMNNCNKEVAEEEIQERLMRLFEV